MVRPIYSAGLHFIISTPDSKPNKHDRRTIRSHTTKARGRRRKAVQWQSWIDPEQALDRATQPDHGNMRPVAMHTQQRFGGALSALQLPMGIEPDMVRDVVKLISLNKSGEYPYEVCLRVHPTVRGWFPHMISDPCCLHAMMFSVRAFMDGASPGYQISRRAAFHHAQTLRLLQARLDDFKHDQRELFLSDTTMMTVIFLAAAAEITGDLATVENHIDGLCEIIRLNGGIKFLNTHTNMQIKVCRADLAFALRSGGRTRLFREDISWHCFVADRGIIRCNHGPYKATMSAFIDSLDPKLGNCWRDLHAFSCISNLAFQTTGKLSPTTYNEMMISILYRLLELSFEGDALQEVVRIALLCFCTTLFLTRRHLNQPYKDLARRFDVALFRLCQSKTLVVPPPILLWLMILYHIVIHQTPSPGDWQNLRLNQAVELVGLTTWSHACENLRSVMWVDFVHDAPGKQAFDVAVRRGEDPDASGVRHERS